MSKTHKLKLTHIALSAVLACLTVSCSDSGSDAPEQEEFLDSFDEANDSLLMPVEDYDRATEAEYFISRAAETRAADIKRTDASRFLGYSTFGAVPADIRSVQKLGYAGWIDAQYDIPLGISHLDRMLATDTNFRLNEENNNLNDQYGMLTGGEWITPQIWETWIGADDQLRQRVAAALLEIFVITARVDVIGIKQNQLTAAAFMDTLEENAFGNFKNILSDVSKQPAMAHYLSFIDNQKASYDPVTNAIIRMPDENYAREILQLFSIGLYELTNGGELELRNGQPIETYTQDDVINLARVFTGWTIDESKEVPRANPLVLNPDWHSPEAKTFLGTTIPANTGGDASFRTAINTIFAHKNVGPFISKQLIQRLVKSNPTPAYVKRVVNVFNGTATPANERGDMKAVIKAILTDEEALNPGKSAIRGKVREPMMRLTAVARVLRDKSAMDYFPVTDTSDTSHGLGQAPMQSPSVFNFFRPGYLPAGSDLADIGAVAPEFQIVTGSAIPGSINFINDYIQNADTKLMARDWLGKGNKFYTKNEGRTLVNYLDLLLTGRRINKNDRAAIAAVINDDKLSNEYKVRTALQLITAHPNFIIQR